MNSKISSDDIPENTFLSSKNILEYIPKQSIKLGIRTYTEGDFFLSIGTPQLVLFRK